METVVVSKCSFKFLSALHGLPVSRHGPQAKNLWSWHKSPILIYYCYKLSCFPVFLHFKRCTKLYMPYIVHNNISYQECLYMSSTWY